MDEQVVKFLAIFNKAIEAGLDALPGSAMQALEAISSYHATLAITGLAVGTLAVIVFVVATFIVITAIEDAIQVFAGIAACVAMVAFFIGFIMAVSNIGPWIDPLGWILSNAVS